MRIILIICLFFKTLNAQKLVILGTLQDGGSPHMGCNKDCCSQTKPIDFVSCVGIYDDSMSVIIDATPDFEQQSRFLIHKSGNFNLSIFLTYAHIGHYTGLMLLVREVASTKNTPVFAMPKMKSFLETNNDPWDQLVKLKNITLNKMENEQLISLSENVKIKSILVPHRDEYSETVGYEILGRNKSVLYIPDIDKWGWVDWLTGEEKSEFIYDIHEELPYPTYKQKTYFEESIEE